MSRTPKGALAAETARRSRHARSGRRDGVWWAGLVVACAAAAATAHGLYAVAAASDVPWPVASLYPVMTDGLALVAYSATNRLTDAARRYAWSVVVLAAGLSGAAQAVYLAGGGLDEAGSAVRFGIGAAPALAAAAVAHLLHLIRTADVPGELVRPDSVQANAVRSRPDGAAVQPDGVRTEPGAVVARPTAPGSPPLAPDPKPSAAVRARSSAERYREQHGALPTVSALVGLADVSRGTAGTVLKGLRTTADDKSPAAEPNDTEPAPERSPTRPTGKIQRDHTPMHHDPVDRPRAGAAR